MEHALSQEIYWPLYAVAFLTVGMASGFAGGLFGVGGGFLRIPLFLYVFPAIGFDAAGVMHMAAGTSLALSIPTSWTTSLTHYRYGTLDTDFLRTWIPALVVGAVVGLLGMRVVSGRVLVLMFSIILVGAALHMLFSGNQSHLARGVPRGARRLLVGGLIGMLSPMVGLSGGTFVDLFLVSCHFPIRESMAIASASALAISLMGTAGSIVNGLGVAGRPGYSLGYVEIPAVVLMTPAVMVTARLGARLADRISPERLKRVFGLFLLALAANTLRQVFGGF
jgi:uncharacterized membrane protein YfcA